MERKQIRVERMRFATRRMLMLYASAKLALRGTRRQASVKVMCDQFDSFFPHYHKQFEITSSAVPFFHIGLLHESARLRWH